MVVAQPLQRNTNCTGYALDRPGREVHLPTGHKRNRRAVEEGTQAGGQHRRSLGTGRDPAGRSEHSRMQHPAAHERYGTPPHLQGISQTIEPQPLLQHRPTRQGVHHLHPFTGREGEEDLHDAGRRVGFPAGDEGLGVRPIPAGSACRYQWRYGLVALRPHAHFAL